MRALFIGLLMSLCAGGAFAAAGDVAGSADYPGIGRFGGSVISGFDVKDFDETVVEKGPVKNDHPSAEQKVQGRITRIAYKTAAGPSILEVFHNFETKIAGSGYSTLYTCETDACGGAAFSEALDKLPIPMMWVDGFGFRYLSAHKAAASGGAETYLTLVVSANNGEIYAQVVAAEVGAIQNKMVDAAAMKKGLSETGHIALYGIYFDTDKADLKPASRPTLDQIAALLKAQGSLKVYIVGHTDSQGGYDYNMNLSKKRAEAVAADLVATYKIDKARLSSAGVGFLSPLGPNATDAGRALNRRVELVQP